VMRGSHGASRPVAAPAAVVCAILGVAPAALAARPVLADEARFGVPGGQILVHYATSGADAVPAADVDADGVPDFVATIATTAEQALARFIELGFRAPRSDGTLGGDGRIDIYLRDLTAADGNTGIDSCDAAHCIGYISAENDYAQLGYSSVLEGIRSVVPHELFHLVQDAYSSAQPSTWTEGSAVWSVEHQFGADNSDFERFLPSFLTRSYRPFERPSGGFGDSYPYGAALWPYFLEHRFGVATVVDAWEASEQATFLDAIDVAVRSAGSTIDDTWTEFTRWNAFTGARAAAGPYPDAGSWPQVPLEPAIATAGTIFVEGVSARYVPIMVTSQPQLTVTPTGGIRIAAWVVGDATRFTDGIALEAHGAALAATLAPGSYTLVVTGLSRGTITTEVDVALGSVPAEADDGGGCSATRPPHAAMVFVMAAVLWRRGRCRALAAARSPAVSSRAIVGKPGQREATIGIACYQIFTR